MAALCRKTQVHNHDISDLKDSRKTEYVTTQHRSQGSHFQKMSCLGWSTTFGISLDRCFNQLSHQGSSAEFKSLEQSKANVPS